MKKEISLEDILGAEISKKEAYAMIAKDEKLLELFRQFRPADQETILGFLQGTRGLPVLFDGFYKYVMDPERHPERLESLLSNLFGQKVTIQEVMTKEGLQLVEKGSLVVMDIIVKLEDGSIVDVEMQKQGYEFSGERSSCYMADMVMRQYNRMRERDGESFTYKNMKPVHLIVLMERSSKEFKQVEPFYIHKKCDYMDSGAKVNLLTNLIYISLDTFRLVSQNIDSSLDAWLTFFSSDNPEDILRLVQKYPEFMECYHDIMEFRRKPKELISMFSEALYKLDRNTEKYMVTELQKEIEENKAIIEENKAIIEENKATIQESKAIIQEQDATILALREEIERLKKKENAPAN